MKTAEQWTEELWQMKKNGDQIQLHDEILPEFIARIQRDAIISAGLETGELKQRVEDAVRLRGGLIEDIHRLREELEALRAGYSALVQLVQNYQMVKDVDIDWDEFPKNTLAKAHEELARLSAWLDDNPKFK